MIIVQKTDRNRFPKNYIAIGIMKTIAITNMTAKKGNMIFLNLFCKQAEKKQNLQQKLLTCTEKRKLKNKFVRQLFKTA